MKLGYFMLGSSISFYVYGMQLWFSFTYNIIYWPVSLAIKFLLPNPPQARSKECSYSLIAPATRWERRRLSQMAELQPDT